MKILVLINKTHQGQKGIGLAETLVAVAILGTCVVAFIAALSTGSLSVHEQEQEVTAQRLAQNQMEYTKYCAFDPAGDYPILTAPEGYAIALDTDAVYGEDTDIQKITVTVLRDGSGVFEVSGYKVNR